MTVNPQTVVVMGGTSGIGLATATLLAQQGFQVIITGRDQGKLDAALSKISGQKHGAVVDATNREQLQLFFADLGNFDHLILCVSGAEGAGPFNALDPARLRQAFEAKFWAQFNVAQAALPALRSSGSITFVSAASAHNSGAGTVGLAAVNGAIEAMVPPLANELRPLRVNAVSPGVVETSWWDRVPQTQRQALFEQAAASLPVGRIGQPEDIADAIAFVVRNSFVTGTVIECDGGIKIKN